MRWLALCLCLCSSLGLANPLVSTEWLAANLNNPKVKVLEVSVAPEQFAHGHIPGAHNLDWHKDLNDPIRRDLISQANLAQWLRNAGINQGDTLVLYGDNHNWFAAWGFWVLDSYGVDNLKLLDGGRVKWEIENRPMTRQQTSTHSPGNLRLNTPKPEQRARLVDVLAVAEGRSQAQLVDIRSPAEYLGEVVAPPGSSELAVRAGHIPGAVNVPWQGVVNADGTFKSKAELSALYASVGVDGSQPVITYCRIGERASHSWFVLAKLLGYSARNYDGSWTEYGNSVGVPINNPSHKLHRYQ